MRSPAARPMRAPPAGLRSRGGVRGAPVFSRSAAAVLPGSAAGVLRLQRAAGNRAVCTALGAPVVQRAPAARLIDKRLTISGTRPAVVDGELVPTGEAPGRFDGYRTRQDALAVAQEAAEISIVVRDRDGRFHVLRTDRASVGGRATPPADPPGWAIEQVVYPGAAAVAAGERWVSEYAAARDAGADRADRYRRLVESWTHIPLAEVAWAPGAIGRNTSAPSDLQPGKVNVVPQLTSAGRHVPAQLEVAGTADLPTPTVMLAASTFAQGPIEVRTTLLHEQRHAYHAAQAMALVREWRGVRKADTMDAWQAWLKAQKKSRSMPVEVYQTTWAMTAKEGARFTYGTATTELYSYLHGFIYALRRLENAAVAPDGVSAAHTTVLRAAMALGLIGREWEGAGEDARKEALRELVAFLKGMTSHHREHVRRTAAAHLAGPGADVPKAFYKRLLADLGSG